MELDRAFTGAFDFEHARRVVAVEGNFRIGEIMRENNVVLEAIVHRCLKKAKSAVAAVGLLG